MERAGGVGILFGQPPSDLSGVPFRVGHGGHEQTSQKGLIFAPRGRRCQAVAI
jgi:hypothetical protein